MEPDTGNLLNAANDTISEAVLELNKKGYKGLVILVDDLDKIVIRPIDHLGCSSAEYLFVHRAAQLTAFNCHVIYSMPISLANSAPSIGQSSNPYAPPADSNATPPPKTSFANCSKVAQSSNTSTTKNGTPYPLAFGR
jgi:hypothetical protein